MDNQFWKKKPLSEFSEQEWESICLRCGKCCVSKCEVQGKILFYNCVCDRMDLKTGLCTRYKTRLGPDCAKVDLDLIMNRTELLPESCAYRLLADGKDLPPWHPLVSGDKNSVRKAKQHVLDIPGIYSEKEFADAFKAFEAKVEKEKWSWEKFKKEHEKLEQKFRLRVIYSQPLSSSSK